MDMSVLQERLSGAIPFLRGEDDNKPGRISVNDLDKQKLPTFMCAWIRQYLAKKRMHEYWNETMDNGDEFVYLVMPDNLTCREIYLNASDGYIYFRDVDREEWRTEIRRLCEHVGMHEKDGKFVQSDISGYECGVCCKLIA